MKLKKGTGSSIRKAKAPYSVDPVWPFGSIENRTQFDEEGFNDWKNAEVRVAHHENSLNHKSCILALRARGMIHGNIQCFLTAQLNEEISYWKNILKRVVAVIKGLASRGLAFRGSNEKFSDQHSGNYIMLLELIAEFDPLLSKHIERYANQGSGTTSYLSKTLARDKVVQRLECITQQATTRFNEKRVPAVPYAVGDRVAIQNTQLATGGKLKPQFQGPFEVRGRPYVREAVLDVC
ncbi:hypothetical protein NQ318_023508 [Aromia moschata]|uniref:DUF4371 domain-containing protein n=1 Tax=Aromia moschata TaxID=1265417 RepID=A0AAV8YPF2_9CUCU|nr:hypothetical protein NQ318_023508 [Aromia moschata]